MLRASRALPSSRSTIRAGAGAGATTTPAREMQSQLRRSSRRRLSSVASSASAASTASTSGRPPPSRDLSLLHGINDATKWTVSAATALVLARNGADPSTRWAVVGAVAAAFATKVLKKIIDEARPATAAATAKADPGMPSSHAQSLAFLSTSAARAILVNGVGKGVGGKVMMSTTTTTTTSTAAAATLVLATAVLLATLRVTLGYHTWPQVIVGGVLGCFFALTWAEVGARFVVPLASRGNSSNNAVSVALGCATALAVGVFGTVTVRSWWKEKEKRR